MPLFAPLLSLPSRFTFYFLSSSLPSLFDSIPPFPSSIECYGDILTFIGFQKGQEGEVPVFATEEMEKLKKLIKNLNKKENCK